MTKKNYTIEQLKNKVLYYINYRVRTKKEVFNKLKQLQASHEDTTIIMKELEQLGLINDQKFIVFFVQDYIEIKRYGLTRVKMELQKKGFESLLIQDTLQQYLSDEEYDPIDNARQLITQKFHNKIIEEQKIFSFLARRGFSYSDAQKALRDYKDSIDDTI